MVDQSLQELTCPSCTRSGTATWGKREKLDGRRRLISVSSGFQKSEGSSGGSLRVVCLNCGTTQTI